ncbi:MULTISPECIES: DUF5667 domain-containing protein [unclassified Streptomyces]|uniref:DUF5667 domain-containing protein n=1 Tax=unclassified Streptomyces TaxID=2593676 RepID=UPI002250DEF0|nr:MULTISPECIES: DUF5667 domain-containing protein [unclassified Streptomyces]MCX4787509.1 DUF5667 domain-containing protein [Streptomyces sp. NBC_01221]MCX4796706.1 DUF5667 domain-containing protein [Streptomyces sp. NBC_01242]WSJ37934.1 DUF5667 domain-containing protein [Streptomyces sp. NBC_01321]WSP64336.1 DUF5667 domain-containing protein [Streptomyces sp. NBC_01240]
MIANVSAHRRADAFAQALEEQSLRGAAAVQPEEPAEPADHGPLLALANGLGELPRPELDPEVKVVQRAQLVAAMEAMFAEGGESTGPTVPEQRTKGAHRASPLRKLRPRSRWAKGLAAGGLTVGVAAGAFGGVAAASSDALPGDSLYGLKRGMEDIHLTMASGDADRGEVYLDQASTRLSEARRLMERARSGDLDHEQLGEVRRTLNGMTHDATEGHRLLHAAYQRDGAIGPIQTLESFSRSHRNSWSSLRDRLPVQLTDVGDQVNSVFAAIDEEVEPLQSLLPRTPGRSGDSRQSDATEQATGSSGTDHSAPSSPEASHGRTDPSAAPHPSASGSAPSDGLIGGSTDGLLGTPPPGTLPSADGRISSPPTPDVTLPPLLPGLLPGLGINSEDLND